MFTKLKKSKGETERGFTIIEVMIVLAIAGLILLIVFLAVPALQRSSRNTQRKNDVGSLASGVSNFASNNNGALPTGASLTGSTVTLTGGSGTSSGADITFGYYTAAPTVAACGSAAGSACVGATFAATPQRSAIAQLLFPSVSAAVSAPSIGPDGVAVLTSATCSGNAAVGGNPRSYAIIYELEQSGSSTTGPKQCQGS